MRLYKKQKPALGEDVNFPYPIRPINRIVIPNCPELDNFLRIDPNDKQALHNFLRKNNLKNKTYVSANKANLSLIEICAKLRKVGHFRLLYQEKYFNSRTLYRVLNFAAASGHLDILEALDNEMGFWERRKIRKMIKENQYWVYIIAAKKGHVEVLKYLEKIMSPSDVKKIMRKMFFSVYSPAAENGHLKVLIHLEKMIFAYGRDAAFETEALKLMWVKTYQRAAVYGHLEILKHIEDLVPFNKSALIDFSNNQSDNYLSFSVLTRTLSQVTPDVVNHLLSFPEWFAQVDEKELNHEIYKEFYKEFHHELENELYNRYWGIIEKRRIDFFIEKKLNELQVQQRASEQENPYAAFDVGGQDRFLFYYILRNLIRRKSFNNDDNVIKINRLLFLPSVQELLTQSVNGAGPNELLHQATWFGNQAAVEALLIIPEVRRLAEENNFYPQLARRGGINLARIAREQDQARRGGRGLAQISQDKESSIRALNQAEQLIVNRVKTHYYGKVHALGGVESVFERFKTELRQRYDLNPASIELDGETLELPFGWAEFQKLKLTKEQRQSALEAYYKHVDHTAFRYLSKPNRWMSEQAKWVEVSEDGQERWARFKRYIPLISYFWVAAADEATPATGELTIESRKDIFIQQLALIGRAHNWDETREVRREDGLVHKEEYDDLKGDKPSCSLGVNRRLFHSIQGHPLFEVLTTVTLNQEVKSFVYDHFQTLFSNKSVEELQKIESTFNQACGMGNEEVELKREEPSGKELAEHDITINQIDAFIMYLKQKYGAQFTNEFEVTIKSRLIDKKDGVTPFDAHLLQFSESAGLRVLLERRIGQPSTPVGSSNQGFWPEEIKEQEEELLLPNAEQVSLQHTILSVARSNQNFWSSDPIFNNAQNSELEEPLLPHSASNS